MSTIFEIFGQMFSVDNKKQTQCEKRLSKKQNSLQGQKSKQHEKMGEISQSQLNF